MIREVLGLAKRVGADVSDHNLSIIAAGMAYNAIFSLFPALAALVSVYGLMADPGTVSQQVQQVGQLMPGEAATIIGDELHKLASLPNSRLGLSMLVSLAIALASVAGGVRSLIVGLNIAYDAKEHRGFIKQWALAVAMALGGIVVAIVALSLSAGLSALWAILGFQGPLRDILSAARWPLLAIILVSALSVFYRWAPCRSGVRWRWITWGSALCTILWVAGSAILSIYVANFGKYDQTYGSIGGVIVLLLWLYFSAFTVLLGAEVDAEMEQRQGVRPGAGE